jgi:general secretion pathway protein G
VAMPMYKVSAKRAKEMELRRDLRTMRDAIDSYKRLTDEGRVPKEAGGTGYPKTLEALTELIAIPNQAALPGQTATLPNKLRFLRKVPVDPMTGKDEWGKRSNEDEPGSPSWGGQDVFDVYSLSDDTALDGTKYKDW